MSLRARLAIALAVLAALSVVAVASISYAATEQRLRAEVDAGLLNEARRIIDPNGPTIDRLCDDLAGGGPMRELGGPLAGLRGGAVQCLNRAGEVTASLGPTGLPVDQPGVDVTRRRGTFKPWTQTFGGEPYRVVAIPRPGGGQIRIARGLAETERVLDSVRNSSAVVGLAIILLAVLAGMLIARQASRPVTRLTDAAEAIAASGRLDIAVPGGGPHGGDEIGRLGRAFSAMLAALTRSRDQQQRLVQDAGHELRTPLTSLRANIDTLRRHPDVPAAPRERLLADLDGEVRELSALVDELVALAVDRYDDEPEQTVSLDAIAERAAARARRRGPRVEVDARPARVVARPQQLLRAVGNLLDNAAKFSPDGATIKLTVRDGHLEVRDHGPGVAAGDLPHVFDRFYRSVDARSLPGSGLGLAIVRQVADDAGGSVEVANHPDGGAVFTLRLPPAPVPD